MRFSALITLILAVTFTPFLGGCNSVNKRRCPDGCDVLSDPCTYSDGSSPCRSCRADQPGRIGLLQRIRNRKQTDSYLVAENEIVAPESSHYATTNESSRSSVFEPVDHGPAQDSGQEQEISPEGEIKFLIPELPSDARRKSAAMDAQETNAPDRSLEPKSIIQDANHFDKIDVESSGTSLLEYDDSEFHLPGSDSDSQPTVIVTSEPNHETTSPTKSGRKNSANNIPPILNQQPESEFEPAESREPEQFGDSPNFENEEPTRENGAIESQLEPFSIDSNEITAVDQTPQVIAEPAARLAQHSEPIILRARPTSKHYLRPKLYTPRETTSRNQQSQPSFRYRQPASSSVPVHRAGFGPDLSPDTALSDTTGSVEFRDLPALSLPSLANVAPGNQKFSHLRAESDAQKAKQRLLDIQAIVKYEIDRRIQQGELLVPSSPQILPLEPSMPVSETVPVPSIQVETVVVPVPVPVLEPLPRPKTTLHQISSKNTDARSNHPSLLQTDLILENEPSQVVRPERKPAVPIQSFEITDPNLQLPSTISDNHLILLQPVTPNEPNLFVPVLESPTDRDLPESSILERTERSPATGTIELRIDSVPIDQTTDFDDFGAQYQMPILKSNECMPSVLDDQLKLLRLRACPQSDAQNTRTIAKFRNVSTQYRYLSTTPDSEQPRVKSLQESDASNIEIPKIRAEPVYNYENRERFVKGLSELQPQETEAKIRILDR